MLEFDGEASCSVTRVGKGCGPKRSSTWPNARSYTSWDSVYNAVTARILQLGLSPDLWHLTIFPSNDPHVFVRKQ